MITELGLGNFKAFGGIQRLPIKPLTLIFGQNSSGKSSLLHGLLLGCHAIKRGDYDVHETDIGGDAVDLGGVDQYIHKGSPRKCVEWEVGVPVADLHEPMRDWFQGFKMFHIRADVGVVQRGPVDFRSTTPKLGRHEGLGVDHLQIVLDGENLLELSCSGLVDGRLLDQLESRTKQLRADFFVSRSAATTGAIGDVPFKHPVIQRWLRHFWRKLSGAQPSPSELALVSKNWDEICDWQAWVEQLIPAGLNDPNLATQATDPRLRMGRARSRKVVVAFASQLMGNFFDEVLHSLRRVIAKDLAAVKYLGPLRSYPPRNLSMPSRLAESADGSHTWGILRDHPNARKEINRWLRDLGTGFEIIVREYLDLNRAADVMGVRLRGNAFRKGSVVKRQKLRLTQRLERIAAGDPESTARQVLLLDKTTQATVSHRDVGVGVSQVLPVLVNALATDQRLIAIEQPELHLHPALQSRLGDLFIKAALGESGNTFLLETHSEHLILRILRRVRETSEMGEKAVPIPVRPEDVSVVFVERTSHGSVVRHLPVTSDGDFAAAWPGGFFAERLADLP